ncbi:hypothetical protein AMAG_11173 [Allomyces macrogynus ATCC 38327]|uniref:Vacuolar sorting protein Vps3844 C-terminal domain-containing protein n=1 Tax=Allomyces macrogynus (strain ATCC 38327) TaxID=578462 RepID=A0A0L0ST51_ALLM3|nr:hypothetical protein AMAG_11173 [Allomyces macrogynus ATCC 38327]|eukprot:KNE65560.1 hypothetical protein AMAG_11173 [Allomyces macrogynus ATCC 38327]
MPARTLIRTRLFVAAVALLALLACSADATSTSAVFVNPNAAARKPDQPEPAPALNRDQALDIYAYLVGSSRNANFADRPVADALERAATAAAGGSAKASLFAPDATTKHVVVVAPGVNHEDLGFDATFHVQDDLPLDTDLVSTVKDRVMIEYAADDDFIPEDAADFDEVDVAVDDLEDALAKLRQWSSKTPKLGAIRINGIDQDDDDYQDQIAKVRDLISQLSQTLPTVSTSLITPNSAGLVAAEKLEQTDATAASTAQSASPVAAAAAAPRLSSNFTDLTCFTSASACSSSTNSCSQHGTCTNRGSASHPCWKCACTKTGYRKYAGASCADDDISSEVALFGGITIAFIAMLAGSIMMVASAANGSSGGGSRID